MLSSFSLVAGWSLTCLSSTSWMVPLCLLNGVRCQPTPGAGSCLAPRWTLTVQQCNLRWVSWPQAPGHNMPWPQAAMLHASVAAVAQDHMGSTWHLSPVGSASLPLRSAKQRESFFGQLAVRHFATRVLIWVPHAGAQSQSYTSALRATCFHAETTRLVFSEDAVLVRSYDAPA